MAYQSWSVVFEEQPSVAKWNILGTNDAHFNDMLALAGAWTSFTPSWTNLLPGTGGGMINQGYYTKIGNTIHARLQMYFGSTGPSMGSNPCLAWPVAAASTIAARTYVGVCLYKDANGQHYSGHLWKDPSADRMQLLIDNVAGTYPTISGLSATVPFTWAPTDEIVAAFSYEAA